MSAAEQTPKVFFSRCKPWNVDALKVALEANRIFFGYCMRKAGAEYKPDNLQSCIVDVTCDDEAWTKHRDSQEKAIKEFNQNRNFVREITRGSIALIPRPSEGVIYCGIVEGEFELIDNPCKEEWFKTWEKCWDERWGDSRRKTKEEKEDLNDAWMAGEIAQTWKVDKFRKIQAARVPVWIRRSLFGRSTYGIVRDQFGLNPYQAFLKTLDENFSYKPRSWTKCPAEVQQRLLTDFTPSAFEHLVVALLQLEHPNEIWTHVGGSGDGGVDGMGSDSNGQVIGLLQCKWIYSGEKLELADVWRDAEKKPRRFLASIHHRDDEKAPDGFEFLTKDKIADLLIKHAAKLPQAVTLRIGDDPWGR